MDLLSILSSLVSHLENSIFHAVGKNKDLASLIEYVLFRNNPSMIFPHSIEAKNVFTQCYTANIELNKSLNACSKALKEVFLQVSDLSHCLSNSQKGIDDAIFKENEIYDVILDKSIDLKNEDEKLTRYFYLSKCKLYEVC